ncbi:unnamed protein product [Heterobilharzia americana]|nr:unnamed protein product [Heterobilharzia americana]
MHHMQASVDGCVDMENSATMKSNDSCFSNLNVILGIVYFSMTELASSYPQSINHSKKAENKLKKKKQIPPPKYLCVSGSLTYINKIPILDKSHTLYNKIKW